MKNIILLSGLLVLLFASCNQKQHACFCRTTLVTSSDTTLIVRDYKHYRTESPRKAKQLCNDYEQELQQESLVDTAAIYTDCQLEMYR